MSAELSLEFQVPPDHPCLPGHFPGEPVVPAVLLLDLACAMLLRLQPQLGALCEVKAAKFMLPVRSGETVRASFTPAGGNLFRFACATAAGVAAQGQLRFGGPR